jgi:Protein of unknown function (DUF998)/Saxitoxin biosynthesis operon protein SxtJ
MNAQATPTDSAGLEHHAPAIGRVSAWCIMVCSCLYIGVVVLEGLLRPDYHVTTSFISELALGSRGFVQIANFIVFGLSILLFAMGVALAFGTTSPARIGVTLLVIVGICEVAAGAFVIDPMPAGGLTFNPAAIGPRHMSFHSKFHYVVSSVAFLLAPVCASCFAFADRFTTDATWQAFRRWSLALGIAMALGLIVMKLATVPPPTNPLQPWRGLLERAMLLPFNVWLFAFGVVLLKRASLGRQHSRKHLSRDAYFGSHEFQARAEVVKVSSDRSFGLTFAAFFTLLVVLGLWRGSDRWPIWLTLAIVMLVLALAAPKVLAPLNRVWSKLGLLLHAVVSPIMLGAMFYGCLTPIGYLMRLTGKDPLRLKYEPQAESYWITRTPPGPQPQSFKDQY